MSGVGFDLCHILSDWHFIPSLSPYRQFPPEGHLQVHWLSPFGQMFRWLINIVSHLFNGMCCTGIQYFLYMHLKIQYMKIVFHREAHVMFSLEFFGLIFMQMYETYYYYLLLQFVHRWLGHIPIPSYYSLAPAFSPVFQMYGEATESADLHTVFLILTVSQQEKKEPHGAQIAFIFYSAFQEQAAGSTQKKQIKYRQWAASTMMFQNRGH